jgi:hypothetical protein
MRRKRRSKDNGLRVLRKHKPTSNHWEARWADTRIHGTTKRQVAAMFAEEKPHLRPLPLEPFRCYQYGERAVHLDGCVEVEAAYYSAPPGWIGRRVQVQWNTFQVRLIDSLFRLAIFFWHPFRVRIYFDRIRWSSRSAPTTGYSLAPPHGVPFGSRSRQEIKLCFAFGVVPSRRARSTPALGAPSSMIEWIRIRRGTSESLPYLQSLLC